MKLITLFSKSNGQGRQSKTGKNGTTKAPKRREASPPAYVSGPDARGHAHDDGVAVADHARHEANPYLSVIQALQNQPEAKKTLFTRLSLIGTRPAAIGPDSLRLYALYELGFTSDPKRAAKIAKGLITVGVFEPSGALLRRDAFSDRVIERLRDRHFSGVKKLTAKEAEGVRVYLDGHAENLQLLGRDVTLLPQHLRADWLYFANIVPSKMESQGWMAAMQEHRVLDHHFLPIDGGVNYERFANNMVFTYARSNPQWMFENKDSLGTLFQNLRESLFPLPTYENAPKYRP